MPNILPRPHKVTQYLRVHSIGAGVTILSASVIGITGMILGYMSRYKTSDNADKQKKLSLSGDVMMGASITMIATMSVVGLLWGERDVARKLYSLVSQKPK